MNKVTYILKNTQPDGHVFTEEHVATFSDKRSMWAFVINLTDWFGYVSHTLEEGIAEEPVSTPQQAFNHAAVEVLLHGATISRLSAMQAAWDTLKETSDDASVHPA